MKILAAIEKAADIAAYISAGILIIDIVLIFAEVFSRFVLHESVIIAEEFSAYSLVAMVFLGLAYTFYHGGHLRITSLIRSLKSGAKWVRIAGLTVGMIWVVVACVATGSFVWNSFERHIRSTSQIMTPLAWPQMVLPIGLALFALAIVAKILKDILNSNGNRATGDSTTEDM